MRRLILLRHAKSSWDDPTQADFDRPLNRRGRRVAPIMARYMAAHDLVPDRILCSTAQRTRETLAALLPEVRGPLDIRLIDEIYEASETAIIDAIRRLGGDARTVLVIGHNPGMEECAETLVGSTGDGLAEAFATEFPTATVAVIDFEIDAWEALAPDGGHLSAFVRPKDLD
ncbi:SixA phosphatase family protein [Amorphus coralli]|uniref:SixA phosphatase family protein n=1 Tax=Amorphus coralli TaxID=340680 RepID=UPI000370F2E0|nr:histidine phosphatase family protein [Amorphus coralli]